MVVQLRKTECIRQSSSISQIQSADGDGGWDW